MQPALKSASCWTTSKNIDKTNAFFPEQIKIDEQEEIKYNEESYNDDEFFAK